MGSTVYRGFLYIIICSSRGNDSFGKTVRFPVRLPQLRLGIFYLIINSVGCIMSSCFVIPTKQNDAFRHVERTEESIIAIFCSNQI